MKSTVKVHGVGFSMDPDCVPCSPLPEASCCPMNLCSLPVDVVVGGVGMYSYPVFLIPLLYCLLVFTYSGLQCSFGLSNVYLTAILAGNLLEHFSSGIFCFTFTSFCFSVLWGLKTAVTARSAQDISIFSLRPHT